MDQISELFKVFHLAHDEIGIRLKQGTKVYAYYAYPRVGSERLKLFKDGLNHFLFVVMPKISP